MEHPGFAAVPMQRVGPIKIIGDELDEEVMVPLATYESPLWPSTQRGAKASRLCGGIRTTIMDERMTRSILVEAPSALHCRRVIEALPNHLPHMNTLVHQQSRHTHLLDFHTQVVGNLLYIRLEFSTGDASGHNMTTQAADLLLHWLLEQYTFLRYVSISANYCTDKKPTAVNGILGRGKYVVNELLIPRSICQSLLKTTPEKIVELNVKKNLIGTRCCKHCGRFPRHCAL